MNVGFTNSPFSANKLLALYAIAMTAVAGGILLLPAQTPTPNVVYNLFKIGQTTANPAQLATGWKPVGYACQAAYPSQIAQGFGPILCGYKYTTASHNLITNGGIDWLACVMVRGAGGVAPRCSALDKYLAVGNPASCTESATDTTLTNELTTGQMGRVAGATSHVNGSATYTVSNTFLPNLSFTGICESGLFTAVSSGTMVFENHFSSTNVISGDSLAVTWTVTL